MTDYAVTKHRARSALKSLLWPVVARLPRPEPRLSWRRSLGILKRRGLVPKTVFDIGVAFGTPQLYRAFPDAYYHLVDPTPESRPHMERLAERLRCEIHNLALGDRNGEIEMEIRYDIGGSTLLEDLGPRDFRRRQKVPMRRFDSLIQEFERPALCKIDVQGAEMLVLEGMAGRLAELDAVLVETSSIATLKQGPELHDVVRFMKVHDFVVFDILGMSRRPLDDAMAQLDLLFVPVRSPLRADRRWSASA